MEISVFTLLIPFFLSTFFQKLSNKVLISGEKAFKPLENFISIFKPSLTNCQLFD